MKKAQKQHIVLGFIALLLGLFIIVQWRSFGSLTEENRDVRKNVFREIQILKETNQNLKDEVKELNNTLEVTSNRVSALESIDAQIQKYKLILGEVDAVGPGISITIKNPIDEIWLVDLVNELFTGGAEAVSVNEIRLTAQTQGFEMLPQGQIFLYVNTLETPYVFKAIGEPAQLERIIKQESGIFDRIKEKFPDLQYSIEQQERIVMKGI